MGDDEAHLLSFMTIHWARVVENDTTSNTDEDEIIDPQHIADEVRESDDQRTRENAAWMIEALAKRLEAEKELRKAAFAEGFQAGIAVRGDALNARDGRQPEDKQ